MAGSVDVDIDALTAFRSHLARFNATLAQEFGAMEGHVRSIHDAWRDAQYDHYADAFAEVARGIERYLDVTGEHERHLQNLIDDAESFRSRRLR